MSLFAFQDIVTSVTGIILLIAMAMAMQVASAPAIEINDTTEEAVSLAERIAAAEAEALRLEIVALQSQNLVADASATAPGGAAEMVASLRKEVNFGQAEVQRLRRVLADDQAERDQLLGELNEVIEAAGVDELQQEAHEIREKLAKLKASNRQLFNLPAGKDGPIYLLELFPGEARIARGGIAEPPTIIRDRGSVRGVKRAVRSCPPNAHWVLFAHPGTTSELESLRAFFDAHHMTIGFDLMPENLTVIDLVEGAP